MHATATELSVRRWVGIRRNEARRLRKLMYERAAFNDLEGYRKAMVKVEQLEQQVELQLKRLNRSYSRVYRQALSYANQDFTKEKSEVIESLREIERNSNRYPRYWDVIELAACRNATHKFTRDELHASRLKRMFALQLLLRETRVVQHHRHLFSVRVSGP